MRSFWFGDDPREDTGRFDPAGQFRVAQLLELFAGHEFAALEPGLLRDRACGRRIVAGDHDSLDAGGPAFADRLDDAGAQRIGKADQSQELEVKFARRSRPRRPGMGGARDAQHAQAGGGHRVDGLRQRRAVGSR